MPKMIKEVLAIPGLTGLFVATLFAGKPLKDFAKMDRLKFELWKALFCVIKVSFLQERFPLSHRG